MPTALALEHHLHAIAHEGELLAELAAHTPTGALVPSCPEWTLHDLVAHQGEVHRWATDTVTGQWDELSPADQADRIAAPVGPALAGWFRDGVAQLVDALHTAPDNLHTPVFLLDAPPPRTFWARRQANETTIHRVDALAAALGRLPTAAETGISDERAIDGIDELLFGFVPRSRTRLRSTAPFTLAVEPAGFARRWHLTISEQPVLTVESDAPADVTFGGSPTELYLGLWNRGDDMTGDAPARARWREQVTVSWH